MDRLTLPKRPVLAESGVPSELSAGIPPGTLPRCAALPLDAKLPMVQGPKGSVVLFTTNLGEKIHLSSQELDFDLTDPNSRLMSNGYKALHDPHLKMHMKEPQMRRRLRKGGFITRDGKVLCTLKEFNEWRQYLRKIYLALERRNEQEQRERGPGGGRFRRGSAAAVLAKQKEERVREVKARIKQQLEDDRQRYELLMKEEEERVQRRRQEQQSKQTEHERKYQVLQERRVSLVTRRQQEERQRKITAMKRWMEADERRVQLLESRRKDRLKEHERRLEDTWKLRKHVQQRHLNAENGRREREEQHTQSRIEEREQLAVIQKNAHQAAFQKIKTQRRRERERREYEYAQNFALRLEKRRYQTQRRRHKKASKSHSQRKWKSNWDIETAILSSFSDDESRVTKSCTELATVDEGQNEAYSGDEEMDSSLSLAEQTSDQGFGDFHGATFTDDFFTLDAASSIMMNSFADVNRDIGRAISQMGMSDMQGAIFNPSIFDLEDEYLEESNLPDDLGPKMVALRDLAEQLVEQDMLPTRPGGPDLEDIAACMVGVSAYVASQVLLPAMIQYQEEMEQDLQRPPSPVPQSPDIEKRSVRFNPVNELITIERASEMISPERSIDEEEAGAKAGSPLQLDMDAEAQKEEDDSFGMMIQGRDSLTKMRRLSLAVENMQPFLGGYTEDPSTDVDDSEEGVDQMDDTETELSSTSSYETPSATTLSSMLKKILDDFSNGKLTSKQVRKLVKVATEIIEGAAGFVMSPESPRPSQSSHSTGISTMAEIIVKHTIDKVQRDLFREYGNTLNETITMAHHNASVNTLASIIVNKALTLAAGAIMNFASEMIDKEDVPNEDQSRRASIPKLPQISPKASDQSIRSYVTPEKSSSDASNVSLTSGTSSYIQGILERVADELQAKQNEATQVDVVPVASKSTTNDFIEGMLRRIVAKLQPAEQTTSIQSIATTSTSSGALTDVVLGTLEHVVKELQLQAKEPSETSQYITSVLNRAADEIREQGVTTHKTAVCRTVSGSSTDSQVSALSDYIRSTLSCAVNEVEAKYYSESAAKSATSLFADELVCDTLNQCLQRIKNGNMSQDELTDLTAAIVEAHGSMSNREELAPGAATVMSDGCPSNISSRTSGLMDQLIADTLAKIQESIVSGKMSGSDISNLAAKINKMSSEESSPRSNNSSNDADAIVCNTITNVLNEIRQEVQPQFELQTEHKFPESEESKEAVLCVHETLQNVVCELSQGSQTLDLMMPEQEKQQSEDETEGLGFQPTVDGKPMDIDEQVLNETLLSISARYPDTASPNEATARNSFLSLVKPEITTVPVIDPASKESVKNSLLSMSSRTLQLKNSALVSQIPTVSRLTPQDSMRKMKSRVISELNPRSIRDVLVPETEEYESDESSEDSDEGRIVSIYDNDMSPARSQVLHKQKSSDLDTKVSPLPALKSPLSTGSVNSVSTSSQKKLVSSGSKSSSRGSINSIEKRDSSAKCKSSTQRLVSPKASKVSNVYGSPSPKTSKTKSSSSRKSSLDKPSTNSTKHFLEDRGEIKVTNSNPSVPRPSQETSSPRQSNPLLHPRKVSMDNIPMTNAASDNISATYVLSPALSGKQSNPKRTDHTNDAPTSSALDVSRSGSKKPSDHTGKAIYGRTLEMTSSGSYQRLKSKESIIQKDPAKSKTRSSHKTMNMTPRPSSAFGKNSENRLTSRSSLGKSRDSAGSVTQSKDIIDGISSQLQLSSDYGNRDTTMSLSQQNIPDTVPKESIEQTKDLE